MANYGPLENGFVRPNFNQLMIDGEGYFKQQENFGQDAPFDTNTNNYQLIAANALFILDLWDALENTFNGSFPLKSENQNLDNVLTFQGLSRNQGRKSTVSLTLTGISGTVILSGKEFSTSTGILFTLDSTTTIPVGGSISANATASLVGTNGNVEANSITIIVNPQIGLSTVNNSSAASGGENREIDTQARERYFSIARTASGRNATAIKTAIDEVSGVLNSIVLENDTDTTDSDGVPAHSFEAIVQGGVNNDIALAIASKKPAAINSHGDITVSLTDSQGLQYNISFSRPTETTVYVRYTLVTDSNYPTDGNTQIQNATVTNINSSEISRDIYKSDLINLVRELNIIGLLDVSVELSTDGIDYTLTNITIDDRHIPVITNARVTFV